jgi:hypothetical protein
MRPSDSAISLGGRSCEVENHVVFCWPLTISLSSNRQLYAHPFEWIWTNQKMRRWFAEHATDPA